MSAPDPDAAIAPAFRIDAPDPGFRLDRFDTGARSGLDKKAGEARLATLRSRLRAAQENLYADGQRARLIVLQAMDAGGKDGTIDHVMSGVNPQGVDVHSFKQPGPAERAHDFLWRIHLAAPSRGRIGIFNRSHYEDVLVTRVHTQLVGGRDDPAFWASRYADIVAFERALAHGDTTVLKFFLHISKEEQRERLLARLDDPAKHWKFSPSDLAERDRWDDYQLAYAAAIAATSHRDAPWFVVPADHKWHARLVVSEAIVSALESLDLHPPALTREQEEAIVAAKQTLRR